MTARLNGQGLPDGWAWTSLGNITDSIQYGHTESAIMEPVGPKFLRITDIQDGQVNWSSVPYCICSDAEYQKYQLTPGDIVFARTGATTGKSYLIQNCPDAVFASYLIRLRVADAIYSKYLSTFFESSFYWSQITQVKKGSAQPGVNASILSTLSLPLAPLNEQHRIVEAIETQFTRLDAAVTALKRAQANLKRYRASVLKAACEGRLVPTEAALAQAEGRSYESAAALLERILAERRRKWEAENPKKKYQEPVAPDTSALPELPEGWCWATTEQLSSFEKYALAIGPFGSNLLVADYCESGIPLVFVRNIRSGDFDTQDSKFVTSDKAKELNAHGVDGGDILITKMGDPPGDACLYPFTRPSAIITADCIKWRLSHVFENRTFFVHTIHSENVHNQILQATRGVAQKKISLARFKDIGIPVPPLAEQQRIVVELERRLSLIDQLEKTIKTDLARANRLRQSILKRAFAGKLVPQHPNDEPASVLLERIHAAKNGQPVQADLQLT